MYRGCIVLDVFRVLEVPPKYRSPPIHNVTVRALGLDMNWGNLMVDKVDLCWVGGLYFYGDGYG